MTNKTKNVTFQTSFPPEFKEKLLNLSKDSGYNKVNLFLIDLVENNLNKKEDIDKEIIDMLSEELDSLAIAINKDNKKELIKIYNNLKKIIKILK